MSEAELNKRAVSGRARWYFWRIRGDGLGDCRRAVFAAILRRILLHLDEPNWRGHVGLGFGLRGWRRLADRWQQARPLGMMLVPAGIFILLIPNFAGGMLDMIVDRYAVAVPVEALADTENEPASELIAELPADFLEGTEPEAASETPTETAPKEVWTEVPPFWRKWRRH